MVNPQAAPLMAQSKEIFFGCLLSQLKYLKLSLGPPIIIIKRNFQALHHTRHVIFDEFPIWCGKIARHKRVDGLTNCCYYIKLLEEIIAWPLRCRRALLCWKTFFADDFREVKSEKWDSLISFCGARMNHKICSLLRFQQLIQMIDWLKVSKSQKNWNWPMTDWMQWSSKLFNHFDHDEKAWKERKNYYLWSSSNSHKTFYNFIF